MKIFAFFLIAFVGLSLIALQFLPARTFSVLAELNSPSFSIGDRRTFFDFLQSRYEDWERPQGPLRVGLQVGHWKAQELPDELEHIRRRVGGSYGGGKQEWEVAYAIAQEIIPFLEKEGIEVDILPATVSPSYWADAFISIHADGHNDPNVYGFRVAGPALDITERAEFLASAIEQEYASTTLMRIHPFVTDDMRYYYAFNWLEREYAIHPMTPAVIVETGFLTSPRDRKILIDDPARAAKGIARGILIFLKEEEK